MTTDKKPPEKIYGWLDTQFSVARFYGGMQFGGHAYHIDFADPKQPLVRDDVLKREAKARRDAAKQAAQAGQQEIGL